MNKDAKTFAFFTMVWMAVAIVAMIGWGASRKEVRALEDELKTHRQDVMPYAE